MRRRWIQDPATGKLVDAADWVEPADAGYYIIGEIEPYKSMCDGTMITSRTKHREHLKVHGVVEIGNDLDNAKRKEQTPPPGLKKRLIEIANEKLRYT